MAWIDVVARLKFWGIDGTPGTINGIPISTQALAGNQFYANVTPFVLPDKSEIINALSDIYFNSPTARAMLDADNSGLDIWLANVTGQGSFTYPNLTIGVRVDLTDAAPRPPWAGVPSAGV